MPSPRLILGLAVVLACAVIGCAQPRAAVHSSASAAHSSQLAPGMGRCSLPTHADARAALVLYEKWKADLLTSDGASGFVRVRRPNSGKQLNTTNSEGIAYGMLLAVYANDQPTFDGLWQYEQLHLGANGLMEWEIAPDGTTLGQGAATDGDEDMAFALITASARWGRGALARAYLDYARAQIELIWRHEVDHSRADQLMPGDQFDGATIINLSYFAPAFYRVFGTVTGNEAGWQRVVDSGYAALSATLSSANRNQDNGLVPAWSTPAGVPTSPPNTGHPIHHQLDSCRVPFRIAQDFCWFDEPRAQSYLGKISAFHERVGVRNLLDGYNLDGTPHQDAKLHLAAFVAGAGAAAMALPDGAKLRDEAYAELIGWNSALGGSEYYNKSWSVLGALMLTGQLTNLAAVSSSASASPIPTAPAY